MTKRLKAVDVYRAVNYTRNQFRGLLAELHYRFEEEFETQPRVARTFSSLDFLVILIACELDSRIGLKRGIIASLLPAIAHELSGPRPVANNPKLVLTFNPPTASYIDHEVMIEDGIVLRLARVLAVAGGQSERMGEYAQSAQGSLNFGPTLVGHGSGKRADMPKRNRRTAG